VNASLKIAGRSGGAGKDSMWRSITHPDDRNQTLSNLGIYADGNLHNPNGYSDDLVRRAVENAQAKLMARRQASAAKAAVTRKRRAEQRVNQIAQWIVEGRKTGPSNRCHNCHRALDDQVSIARGIGSECWQVILRVVERMTRGEAA
jgi:hypothetical protein